MKGETSASWTHTMAGGAKTAVMTQCKYCGTTCWVMNPKPELPIVECECGFGYRLSNPDGWGDNGNVTYEAPA